MLESQLKIQLNSPEQPLHMNWSNPHQCHVTVKRDDLLHPIISGNKWRKLKYNLLNAVKQNTSHIISFGGNYSNHLHALAYCCQQLDIPLTAMVRGYASQPLTPTLLDIKRWGATLEFLDKKTYQQRYNPEFMATLQNTHGHAECIPEGGSNKQALKGVAEIVTELQAEYDYILCPVGSGGTMAGLIHSGFKHKLLGIAVLKGQDYLESLVENLLPQARQATHWQILHQYHHGGYARVTEELTAFCQSFNQTQPFMIEPVYSGKLFYGVKQLMEQGFFPVNSRILLLHTGGLQGARSTPD